MRSRFLLTLLVTSLVALTLPGSAAADDEIGSVSVQVGTLSLREAGERTWHPQVRLAGALRLVGPLEIGAFAQVSARALPLKQPGFGGGAFLALRPSIGIFRPLIEVNAGYHRIPVGQTKYENVWAFGGALGAGLDVHEGVTLDVRVGYSWLVPPDVTGVGPSAWTLSLGLTFAMP